MSQVANGRFQRRFAQPHDVVSGDDTFATQIGQSQDAAAIRHHVSGSLADSHQAVHADVHRHLEPFATAGVHGALQIVDWCISD